MALMPVPRLFLYACLCVVLITVPCHCDIPEHEVIDLPGWAGKLPSRQYSGYINIANNTKHLHYWFTESEGDVANDPVVLWLNGGPGASSLYGLFVELGQLVTDDRSLLNPVNGAPGLQRNPYAWTKLANLLVIESPAGVGYSYCDKGIDCKHTDESTADDTLEFMQVFFDKFSEFAKHRVFLTGESYAGVYTPMLADRMSKKMPDIDLRGIAVGNGCWGNKVGLCSDSGDSMAISTQFFHAHLMMDDRVWEGLQKHCDWYNVTDPLCHTYVDEMVGQMGKFNLYNVYDNCGQDLSVGAEENESWIKFTERNTYELQLPFMQPRQGMFSGRAGSRAGSRELQAGMGDYRCGGEAAMGVLQSHPGYAQAIHVLDGTPFWGGYTRSVADLRPLYTELSDKMRVLIYSGDVDGCVPTQGTESYFLGTLDLNLTKPWTSWNTITEEGKYAKAGYHEKFVGTQHGIDFVTVNGAGHMVPLYKPAEMFTLLMRWLADDDLVTGRKKIGMDKSHEDTLEVTRSRFTPSTYKLRGEE